MHLQNVRVPFNHSRPQDVISHTHQRSPYQFTSFAFSQTLVFKLYQMPQEALLLANRVGQKVFNPSLGEFPGGKGQRSNVVRRRTRGGDKKFLRSLAKSFWRSLFTPWMTTRRCYDQPFAGERTRDDSPGEGMGMNTPDTTERRGAIRVPAVLRRHGESGATGTVAASAAVGLDFRHQTLADRPETA